METMLLVLAVGVLSLSVTIQLKADRTDRKVARLERKIDLILGHLGLQELGPAELESVRALLISGKKIEAIRLYRQITDAGLKEAKEAVEAMER